LFKLYTAIGGGILPEKGFLSGINIRKLGLEDFGANTLKRISFNGKYYQYRGNNNRSVYRKIILISTFKLSLFHFINVSKCYECCGNYARSIYRVTMLICASFLRRLREIFPRKRVFFGDKYQKMVLGRFWGNSLKCTSFNDKCYDCRGNNNSKIYASFTRMRITFYFTSNLIRSQIMRIKLIRSKLPSHDGDMKQTTPHQICMHLTNIMT
jgi:hypothetical protein